MSVRDNIRAGEELSEEEIQNAVNQLEVRKKIRNLDQSISGNLRMTDWCCPVGKANS